MPTPHASDRALHPAVATRLRELVERVGRQRIADWGGVSVETVRLWASCAGPGLKSLEMLSVVAAAHGFGDLAASFRPLIKDKRRRMAWLSYNSCARLYAMTGDWPLPELARRARQTVAPRQNGRFVRLSPNAPRWLIRQRVEPPDPPPDMPEARLMQAKNLLERQGRTLIRSADNAWHVVRLGGWVPLLQGGNNPG